MNYLAQILQVNERPTRDRLNGNDHTEVQVRSSLSAPFKGGDPAAPSDTATLLRLHPNHQPQLRAPTTSALHRERVLSALLSLRSEHLSPFRMAAFGGRRAELEGALLLQRAFVV